MKVDKMRLLAAQAYDARGEFLVRLENLDRAPTESEWEAVRFVSETLIYLADAWARIERDDFSQDESALLSIRRRGMDMQVRLLAEAIHRGEVDIQGIVVAEE